LVEKCAEIIIDCLMIACSFASIDLFSIFVLRNCWFGVLPLVTSPVYDSGGGGAVAVSAAPTSADSAVAEAPKEVEKVIFNL